MKKRMWLWCLIAAFGMSIVACSDDDEKETPTPPQTGGEQTPVVPPTDGGEQTPEPTQSVIVVDTMEVIANVEEVPYTGGTIQFVTKTNVVYSVDTDQEWIKITSDGRALTAEYTVTATVDANEGEAREGVITVTFEDEATTVKTVTVKQAAKPAEDPEQTPEPTQPEGGYVIPEGAKTYTVEVDVAGYVDVASQYNVADLIAGCDTEATVQMAYLNENGELAWQDWTVTDGWFGVEGAHNWGAGCIACIKPNTDGSFGYVGAFSDLEVGASATAIFNYGNGVIVAITANVIASPSAPEIPDSGFVAPEADYVLDVQVVQDNGWGATYFALDGTDVTGWSKYEDAAAYVNPVAGVSVDITAEIEAALGLEIGTLKDELLAGSVYLGSYNANNEFMDCYEVHGSNYFFWFEADGSALSSYAGYACIDNLGFVGEDIRLYGTTCLMPNKAVVGTTYSTYIVFKTEEAEYVVQLNEHAVEAPEAIVDETEYEIVKTYEVAFETSFANGYSGGTHVMDAGTVSDMATLIGLDNLSDATYTMLNAAGEVVEDVNGLGGTNGWYGVDGPASWGNGSIVFFNKDGMSSIDSWAYGCHPDIAVVGDVVTVKVQFRNAAAAKAANYFATITVVE